MQSILWINWPLHDFLTGHMNVFMHFEVPQRFFRLWYFLLVYRASPYQGTYWCLSKVSYQTEDQWLTIVPSYAVILWLGRRKKQSFAAQFFIRNKILFKESEKVENRVQGVLWTRHFKQSLRIGKQPPNVEGKCVIDRQFTDHLPIFGLITSIFVGCRLLFGCIKNPLSLFIWLFTCKQIIFQEQAKQNQQVDINSRQKLLKNVMKSSLIWTGKNEEGLTFSLR